jgi:MFS family permease
MDIERLKGAWKSYTDGLKEQGSKNTSELREILSRKSEQSLRRLRKNFFIEAGINLAAIPIVLVIVINQFAQVGDHRYYLSGFLVLLLLAFLVFLYNSYMKIFRYEQLDMPLEQKLEEQVKRLKLFMKNYAVIGYILYFLVFVAGLLVSAYNNLTGELPRLGVGILIALALFFSVIRPMIRYYLKRLYGKHLDSLTSYLNELQENHP